MPTGATFPDLLQLGAFLFGGAKTPPQNPEEINKEDQDKQITD